MRNRLIPLFCFLIFAGGSLLPLRAALAHSRAYQDPYPSPTESEAPAVLQVTGVEPNHVTIEFGGPISVYGTGFTQGTAVRMVGVGLLDTMVMNSTALRIVIPAGVPKGSYDLQVLLPDGSSTTASGVVKVRPMKSPTPTATVRARQGIWQPQLVVAMATTTPDVLRPGIPFTLTLQIANLGDYPANNVRVSLGSPELAVPLDGSSLVVVNQLASKAQTTLEVGLALSKSVTAGYHNLSLSMLYADYLGRSFTSEQTVGLNVADNLANQPVVLLSSYATQPEALSPGDAFTLKLAIANVGDSEAQKLLVTLGGENGQGIKPFAILGAGNVQFIPSLAAGDRVEVEQHIMIDGSTDSGVYNLPISLAYEGASQERKSETQTLNLLINRRPTLKIGFYRDPVPVKVGEELTLPVELVNIGRTQVNVSTMEVSGAGFQITTGSTFVGALDGGTSGTLDAVVVPEESGSLPVTVTVNYLDDFNRPQVVTQTLQVQVEAAPQATPGAPAGAAPQGEKTFVDRLVQIFKGLIGLGS